VPGTLNGINYPLVVQVSSSIRPNTVAGYVEQLAAGMARPSVKQHLAGIRQLFDYLVTGGIILLALIGFRGGEVGMGSDSALLV